MVTNMIAANYKNSCLEYIISKLCGFLENSWFLRSLS